MYVTINSALVWKRVADENQQSAELLARISVGLLAVTVIVGIFAYLEHKRNADLCSAIRVDAQESGVPLQRAIEGGDFSVYCG